MLKYIFNSCGEISKDDEFIMSYLSCDFCDNARSNIINKQRMFNIYFNFHFNNQPLFSILRMTLCEPCHQSYCCSCLRAQGKIDLAQQIEEGSLGLELVKVTQMGRSHVETKCTFCIKKIRKYINNGANIVCYSYKLKNSGGRYGKHLCIYLCDECYNEII